MPSTASIEKGVMAGAARQGAAESVFGGKTGFGAAFMLTQCYR